MAQAMNFQPQVYEVAAEEKWGRRQLNGSYTGLLGQVLTGRAQVALGNLQHNLYTLKLIDLSLPYMSQCLTFLTPESRSDNKWRTLILPFLVNVWIALLITLLLGGFIFFSLARFHRYLENLQYYDGEGQSNLFRKKAWMKTINFGFFPYKRKQNMLEGGINAGVLKKPDIKLTQHGQRRPVSELNLQGMFIFEELINSILYTYSMLMFVSLPKMPSGWALRLMLGCWWFYALLLVVSYRASLTAILAKPEPVVTIDTINELVSSPIRCGGWGEMEKMFFTTSFDPDIHKIGIKFETVADVDKAISEVAVGTFAYYENKYFLMHATTQHLSGQMNSTNITDGKEKEEGSTRRNLHIMSDCIISIPISLGLERNSPLKPRVDQFVQRVVEAGLVHKWLNDVMEKTLRWREAARTEQVILDYTVSRLYKLSS